MATSEEESAAGELRGGKNGDGSAVAKTGSQSSSVALGEREGEERRRMARRGKGEHNVA